MSTDSTPRHVLLVEAHDDTRILYGEFLRQNAWEIEEAVDGRAALAKALARPPGVVITETRLPGISGVDLCTILRTDAALALTPIVVVTGVAVDAERARKAGADRVLIKPCLPNQLAETITDMLASSKTVVTRALASASELREMSRATRRQIDASQRLTVPRIGLRARDRYETIRPPQAPPTVMCPTCLVTLTYEKSHVGGLSPRFGEQWDWFVCPRCSLQYEYRQRTRKLSRRWD
jgi:CheY-like chemotaxis protein